MEQQSKQPPRLVPELVCSDLGRSLAFYRDVLGFSVVYDRPEERFAYLDLGGAHLMLDQPDDRSWVTAELLQPYGRGINLQIEVADAEALQRRVKAAGLVLFQPMRERWYRRGGEQVGQRQFLVMDPDGYLLRFYSSLGVRLVSRLTA